MRTKNTFINVITGVGCQFLITILSFLSRTIFITTLGVEYLGINGVFTNILGFLTLAEAGIGSSIIYALYKPLANNDTETIKSLVRLYKNAYRVIAGIILILGLVLMPFLPYIIGDTSVKDIYLIYFLFLANTVIPYLFIYKIQMLNVTQKGYIPTSIYTTAQILTTVLRIGLLLVTRNFILYLLIEIVTSLLASFVLSIITERMYPYIKSKQVGKLQPEVKHDIIKNIKAVMLHQIGAYIVFGTDNIIISSFIGLAAVGLYSNYLMLINICRTFINQIFDNVVHSVGNLVAEDNKEKTYNIFKVSMFINFWMYSLVAIGMYILLDPFIELWLGKEFILDKLTVVVILINLYITGLRRSINIIKTTSGIFHQDRFAPFVEAAINLIASITLVHYLGLAGVFLGTLISTLTIPFWLAPYLVYKLVFKLPLRNFFLLYAKYAVIGLVTLLVTNFSLSLIIADTVAMFIVKGLAIVLIINVAYFLIYRKSDEYNFLAEIVMRYGRRFTSIVQKKLKKAAG